ncbi:uncharacterized protein SEPMUDRAFT_125412 [Sphaerulina musiva SO2202]|uniref:Uncharacterized protein n=1 Tax=Sphaerulina musiva (strain SO2202) TaxID=692275 RepID=M3D689_SPHMS|nr:uncharacterized protein SEPMUDRAFT_125412 [Sphaerulina musiva SO2202]EMF13695.1 hypothetical protein SEPMUDRAFT_125412 [Sphaerulina musiva SO2202]
MIKEKTNSSAWPYVCYMQCNAILPEDPRTAAPKRPPNPLWPCLTSDLTIASPHEEKNTNAMQSEDRPMPPSSSYNTDPHPPAFQHCCFSARNHT